MPLGTSSMLSRGSSLAIALGLPAAVCGQQPLLPAPPAADSRRDASAASARAAPGVCPECGQPYDQPPAAAPGGGPSPPLIGNIWIHPPWERAGRTDRPDLAGELALSPVERRPVRGGRRRAARAMIPMRTSTTARAASAASAPAGTSTITGARRRGLPGAPASSTTGCWAASIDCRTNSFFWRPRPALLSLGRHALASLLSRRPRHDPGPLPRRAPPPTATPSPCRWPWA